MAFHSSLLNMAEIYETFYTLCRKLFGMRNALENILTKSTLGMTYRKADFFLGDKQDAKVYSRLLRKRVQYLEWLAELVECRNSAHNLWGPVK